jgi:spore maturation protein CgeB
MRVFQAIHKYRPYIPYFESKYDVTELSYEAHRQLLMSDRFYSLHILKPCLEDDQDGFYTMWNYEALQLKWAKEKGWNETDLKKILFAQIEEFKPDVFYCGSPVEFTKEDFDFGISPKIKRICWAASPSEIPEKYKLYETRLTNLPLHIKSKSEVGYRNDMFTPAYDNFMDKYNPESQREIDLFFYGQYSFSFQERNKHINRLLEFKKRSKLNIQISLQYNIKTVPYPRRFLRKFMTTTFPRPSVQENSISPLYGVDLYDKLANSKVVFNAGVDFSKNYKVNMRNFEVLGCGAHMISDDGIYPDNFKSNQHYSTYSNMEECIERVHELMKDDNGRIEMAKNGKSMIKKNYNKTIQWDRFQEIIASL